MRRADLSMPGYIMYGPTRLNKLDIKGVNSPYIWRQVTDHTSLPATPLTEAQIKTVQEIISVFFLFYYARAVDHMIITSINKLESRQASVDSSIFKDTGRLFQYASRIRNAVM